VAVKYCWRRKAHHSKVYHSQAVIGACGKYHVSAPFQVSWQNVACGRKIAKKKKGMERKEIKEKGEGQTGKRSL